MPRRASVIIGNVYGRLTVKAKLLNREVGCICECGNVCITHESHLTQGRTRSCGCLHNEVTSRSAAERNRTHGMGHTKVYHLWRAMVSRCHNPNNQAYKNYGARGIAVSEPWKQFQNFFADMGHAPKSMTLERIDNSLGYSKSNCRWASRKDQSNNTRVNVSMTAHGRTQTAMQWTEELGFNRSVLYDRKKRGWSDERALTTPVRGKPK